MPAELDVASTPTRLDGRRLVHRKADHAVQNGDEQHAAADADERAQTPRDRTRGKREDLSRLHE